MIEDRWHNVVPEQAEIPALSRYDSRIPRYILSIADGRRGSTIYAVNLWMRSFARGKPRLGGLSVEKTFEGQVEAGEASKKRAAETRRRRKACKA